MDDVRFSPWGKKAKEKVQRNFKCEGVCGAGSPMEEGAVEESREEKKINIKHK